jgi:Protein of unknown function (DUF3303)
MKFVVSWIPRSGGSAIENEAAAKRNFELFAKWTPPTDVTFHVFVARLDGNGGFAVVEGDNPASLSEAAAKFGPYFEFHSYPVADVTEVVEVGNEAIAWRDSI